MVSGNKQLTAARIGGAAYIGLLAPSSGGAEYDGAGGGDTATIRNPAY